MNKVLDKLHFLCRNVSEKKWLTFFMHFICIFLYDIFLFNLKKDIIIGDAQFYWYGGDAFIKNGSFSFLNYFHGWPYLGWPFVTFRGYLPQLITLGIRHLADILNIHFLLIYITIASIIFATFFIFIIPMIYELTTGKKAKIWHSFVLLLLVFISWRGFFFYLLMDFYGLIVCIINIIFMIKVFKEPLKMRLFLFFIWGIFASVMVQLRSNYVIILGLSLFSIIISYIINFINEYKQHGRSIKGLIPITSKFLLGFGLFLIAIIIVETPQLIINWSAGYKWRFFPFDNNNSLLLTSASQSFKYVTLYPISIPDYHAVDLFKNYFKLNPNTTWDQITTTFTSIGDLIKFWLCYPVESIFHYIQRLFNGMDIRFSNPYPTTKDDIKSLEIFIVMLSNYTVLFIGILSIVFMWKEKILKNSEKFLVLVLTLLTLLQVFLHVEWRYFIPGYFLLYYFSVFYGFDLYLANRNKIKFFIITYLFFIVLCIIMGNPISKGLIMH